MLVSTGAVGGGLVGLNVDSGAVVVLFEPDLWGYQFFSRVAFRGKIHPHIIHANVFRIVNANTMVCDNGELVLQVCDWHADWYMIFLFLPILDLVAHFVCFSDKKLLCFVIVMQVANSYVYVCADCTIGLADSQCVDC